MATVYLAQDLQARPRGRDQGAAPRAGRQPRPRAVPARDQDRRAAATTRTSCRCTTRARPASLLYYVMPYVEGESLRAAAGPRAAAAARGRRATSRRAVAAALDYAHRQQVVHRDIKPENVMLHEGEAMVTDFGIAKAVTRGRRREPHADRHDGRDAGLHEPGAGGGRARSSTAGATSTAWAACCTRCSAGAAPFTGPTAQAMIAQRFTEAAAAAARAARRTVPGVPRAGGHEGDGDGSRRTRFDTAAQFAQALAWPAARRPHRPESCHAGPSPPRRPSRSRCCRSST